MLSNESTGASAHALIDTLCTAPYVLTDLIVSYILQICHIIIDFIHSSIVLYRMSCLVILMKFLLQLTCLSQLFPTRLKIRRS